MCFVCFRLVLLNNACRYILFLYLPVGLPAVFLFKYFSDYKIQQGEAYGGNNGILYIFSIFKNSIIEAVFRNYRVKIPAESCKYAVPRSGTYGGVEQELSEVHA